MRRWDDRHSGGAVGCGCPRRGHRRQSRRGRPPARGGRKPVELPVRGRRCIEPRRACRSQLRSCRQHFRRDVRAPANWIPNDPTLVAQILKTSAAYSPPPPEGFVSPMTWGIESNVIERFGSAGIPKEKISLVKDTYVFNYPGAASELVAAFRTYYGPTMNAFEAAQANGREADLQAELDTLFNEQNTSDDATSIPATFLRVTVEK